MTERDYAYVATQFDQKSIEPFVDLTSQIVKPSDLYVSDKVSYVKGDVSNLLHMTVFYGLIDGEIDLDKINSHCKSFKSINLKLGEISIKNDYSGLCQIIWINVLDANNELFKISETFKNFRYDKSVQLGFVPHLTLAYVKSDYKLPIVIPSYPKEIAVSELKYFKT